MADYPDQRNGGDNSPLSPLRLVNRLVTLLYLVVLLPIIVLLFFLALYIYLAFREGFIGGAVEMMDKMIGELGVAKITGNLWEVLAPIISIIVLVMLLRWLFCAPGDQFIARQLRQALTDVPSLIAVIVIATVCVLPLLKIEIPDPLGNIALVIVGFYFGTERKLKGSRPQSPREEKESG